MISPACYIGKPSDYQKRKGSSTTSLLSSGPSPGYEPDCLAIEIDRINQDFAAFKTR